MSSIKDEAKRLIDGLPDGANWDDIMYQLYVKQKIEAAIAAADAGRVLSHDEVRKRVLDSAD